MNVLVRKLLMLAGGAAALVAAAPAQATCAPVTVYFGWNSAVLDQRSREAIERLALSLAWKGPDLHSILLTSHADTSGSPAANQAIALRRARAVRQLLIDNEVPERLIRIMPMGEDAQRVPTGPNIREPRNRRVELLVQLSAEAQARQLADAAPLC